jgi:hypothetical protein
VSWEFKDYHLSERRAAYTVHSFERLHLHRAGTEVLKLPSCIIFIPLEGQAAAMINLSGL